MWGGRIGGGSEKKITKRRRRRGREGREGDGRVRGGWTIKGQARHNQREE